MWMVLRSRVVSDAHTLECPCQNNVHSRCILYPSCNEKGDSFTPITRFFPDDSWQTRYLFNITYWRKGRIFVLYPRTYKLDLYSFFFWYYNGWYIRTIRHDDLFFFAFHGEGLFVRIYHSNRLHVLNIIHNGTWLDVFHLYFFVFACGRI